MPAVGSNQSARTAPPQRCNFGPARLQQAQVGCCCTFLPRIRNGSTYSILMINACYDCTVVYSLVDTGAVWSWSNDVANDDHARMLGSKDVQSTCIISWSSGCPKSTWRYMKKHTPGVTLQRTVASWNCDVKGNILRSSWLINNVQPKSLVMFLPVFALITV